jgi:hypothetical protein
MCHHRNALLPPIWTLSHALTDQTTIHSSLYHVYMLSPLSCKRNQIQDRSIHVKSSAKKLGSKVEREGYGQQFQLPTQITFRMNRKSKFQTRKRAHIWPSFLHIMLSLGGVSKTRGLLDLSDPTTCMALRGAFPFVFYDLLRDTWAMAMSRTMTESRIKMVRLDPVGRASSMRGETETWQNFQHCGLALDLLEVSKRACWNSFDNMPGCCYR